MINRPLLWRASKICCCFCVKRFLCFMSWFILFCWMKNPRIWALPECHLPLPDIFYTIWEAPSDANPANALRPSVFPSTGAADFTSGMIADQREPPCFTAFLICVFDIFKSTPSPFAFVFLILLICVFVNIISSGPVSCEFDSLIVIVSLFLYALTSFRFWPSVNLTPCWI